MKYLAYWGLEKNPFEKDVISSKLTASNDFTQASAGLKYLLKVGGIGLLTGRTGFGKTTAARAVIDEYPPGLIKPYYIELSTIKVSEFYRMLATKLNLEAMRYKSENFQNIQTKIRSIRNDDRIMPILILDEAQYLCKEILIDLPILMNFDMDSKSYAALLLIGLPSLNSKLNMEQYECLRDRLVFNYEISGISLAEAHTFIQDRLSDAGITRNLFEESAITAAHSSSRGSLRRLGLLLNESLMVGCNNHLTTVDAAAVHAAAESINLGEL